MSADADDSSMTSTELEATIAETLRRIGEARRRQEARRHPLGAVLRSDALARWKRRLAVWRR